MIAIAVFLKDSMKCVDIVIYYLAYLNVGETRSTLKLLGAPIVNNFSLVNGGSIMLHDP